MIEQELKRQGAEGIRVLDDGYVAVFSFIYNDRVVYGRDADTYERGFCFPKGGEAHEAARSWDGVGDPSGPWIKEVGTERYGPGMAAIK